MDIAELISLSKDALSLVGGGGGILFLYDRLRKRPALRARVLQEDAYRGRAYIWFEVTNLGSEPQVLDPEVKASGWSPTAFHPKGHYRELTFKLQEGNRILGPMSHTTFEAIADDPDRVFPHLWFKKYLIRRTRGRGYYLFVKGAAYTTLGREVPLGKRGYSPLEKLFFVCTHVVRWNGKWHKGAHTPLAIKPIPNSASRPILRSSHCSDDVLVIWS